MKRHYSRLASVEEKRNIKKAYAYVLFSIAAAAFLFVFGLPTLIRFAGFVGNLGKSDEPVGKNDLTPPAPPTLERTIEFTNEKNFMLKGNSENGATVKIDFNGDLLDTVANAEGTFQYNLTLKNGDNLISASAIDLAGNTSQPADVYKIIFDDEKPDLTIDSPQDNSSYYGSVQRQLTITGRTSDDAEIYVNGRYVSIKEDQTFTFATTLNEGVNDFEVIAKDQAGNEAKSTFAVSFTP